MFNHRLYYLVMYTILFSSISLSAYAADMHTTEGAELYHDYCSVCHGDKGDGNSRAKEGLVTQPRDFTQPGLSKVLTREQMIHVLLHGRPGTAMVGWSSRLSKDQAASIVDYIRSTFMSHQTDNSVNKSKVDSDHHVSFMDQTLSDGLVGNYDNGKLFYESNCATCHGIKGDGNGPRAYFIFPKPRNFLAKNSRMRLNRTVLFNAIKYGIRGKEMPAWGKVINDQEIANVVEYVFKAMIQSENVTQSGTQ